jgi:hypothetical protein
MEKRPLRSLNTVVRMNEKGSQSVPTLTLTKLFYVLHARLIFNLATVLYILMTYIHTHENTLSFVNRTEIFNIKIIFPILHIVNNAPHFTFDR